MKEKIKYKIAFISTVVLLITCVGLGVGIGICYANFPNSQKTFIESNRAEVERIFTDAQLVNQAFLDENKLQANYSLQLYSYLTDRDALTLFDIQYASVTLKKENALDMTYTIFPEFHNKRKKGTIEYEVLQSVDIEYVTFIEGDKTFYAAYFYQKYLMEIISADKKDLQSLVNELLNKGGNHEN